MTTKIEWTDETWNPVTGCTPISEGCANCYAKRMAQRLRGRFGYPADDPFGVACHRDRFDAPERWRKPRRVFVCSMGDLFHKLLPVNFPGMLEDIFDMMQRHPQHVFQVLTKRPAHMREFTRLWKPLLGRWPAHIWLGVTTENQQRADERIPLLLDTPAQVKFVSCEPLLGPIDLQDVDGIDVLQNLQWVIAGCETGQSPRHADEAWFRSLAAQCDLYGVPFFLKQMAQPGAGVVKLPALDGHQHMEWPQ